MAPTRVFNLTREGGGRWSVPVRNPSNPEDEMKGLLARVPKAWPKPPDRSKVMDSAYIKKEMAVQSEELKTDITKALDLYIKQLVEAYTYQENETKDVKRSALNTCSPGEIQSIVRKYLAVQRAAKELTEARIDEAEIEAPFKFMNVGFSEGDKSDFGDGKFHPRSATRAMLCCTVFSVLLGLGALIVAGIYYGWGSGKYTKDAEDAANKVNATMNATIELEAGTFWDGNFWGWPSEKAVRNIWCGLMLGLVFGFLDNFGLFYGTSALDCTFYSIGNKLASGLLADTADANYGKNYNTNTDKGLMPDQDELRIVALKAHEMTEDMMNGLGNTFSDLLGVALGTAALEIAKAGLGVEPSWWPGDLLAIVLGCLLGVFLPVLVKYRDDVASGGCLCLKYVGALIAMFFIFASVLIVGIPEDREADVPVTIWVSLVMTVFVVIFLVVVVIWLPLMNANLLMHKQQWAVLKTPVACRLTSYDEKAQLKKTIFGSTGKVYNAQL